MSLSQSKKLRRKLRAEVAAGAKVKTCNKEQMPGEKATTSSSLKKVIGSLHADFFRTDRNTFSGFAYNNGSPTRKFTVELLVDGQTIAAALADELVADLIAKGVGDGRFGFTFSVPEAVIANAEIVEARLANLDIAVGRPIACDDVSPENYSHQIGDLSWVGGLRFEGWVTEDNGPIEILVAQQPVMTVTVTGWTHINKGDGFGQARRLDFHLPEHFADGRVRLLSARTSAGRSIVPQDIAFVAFDGGLAKTLADLGRWESEQLRGKLFDQLIPASIPFHAYDDWKTRFSPPIQSNVAFEAAVMLVGDDRVDESIDSLEAQTQGSWTAVSLPTKGAFSRFDPKPAMKFLDGDAATSDFVVLCVSGTIFADGALRRFAEVFEAEPDCNCVYGDIDVQGDGGAVWPLAFPAFDRERSLEQGYAALLFAMRRKKALDAIRSTGSLYELFNTCVGVDSRDSTIRHIPGALAALPQINAKLAVSELVEATRTQLEKIGVRASIEPRKTGMFPAVRVRREINKRDRTTIVIPTRNRVELLKKCIDTIQPAASKARAKILIVDNDSTDPETAEYLASATSRDIEVLSVKGPFNFSQLNNTAVRHSNAHNICLLNNDIEAIDDDWLSEMLSRLSDPDVGAVGAKLLWPNGVVQHGGVVLGTNFAATHAFNDRIDGDPGYGDLLNVAHECSAVTAACLLLRRKDYLAVEGMDEIRFPINFNDVDLCLKLRQRGQRIVFAPDAKLLHLESASRGRDKAPARKARFDRELLMLQSKWRESLLDDPYYNPILGLDSTPFSALAWPPRSWQSRTNRPPRPSSPPIGL